MRLIDADKLFINLNDWALAESPTGYEADERRKEREIIYKTINDCMKAIEEQPTAYDVDKVVEELDELKGYYWSPTSDIVIEDAIEIVKRGGVDGTE